MLQGKWKSTWKSFVPIYTGNFHKWVFTPRGCAILWIAKQHHDWCTPLVTSHMYKKGVQLEYFMQGTRDNIPYFLVPEALKFFSEIGGMVNNYVLVLWYAVNNIFE